jgi:hypothetical protein
MSPVLPSAALEHALTAIESRLAALGAALRDRDALAIDSSAVELQRALAAAVQRFKHSNHPLAGVSPELRHRLAAANAQVGAHRESLARASAALERAVQVLMPPSNPAPAYAAQGGLDHLARGDYVGA